MTCPTDTHPNTECLGCLHIALDDIAARVGELRDQLYAFGEQFTTPDTTASPDTDEPGNGPLTNQALALAQSITELTAYTTRLRDSTSERATALADTPIE